MSELVTLKEAAAIMGIESRAVKREANRVWEILPKLLKQGFPARKVGRRWFVHRGMLYEWMKKYWASAA